MVKWRGIADSAGTAFVEALITLPIVILLLAASVELTVVAYQWNQTAKAIQLAARLLSVSDPATRDFAVRFPATAPDGVFNGTPSPIGDRFDSVCSPALSATAAERANCVDSVINRIIYGADGRCQGVGDIRPGACDLLPSIGPANLRVIYIRSGLGYWGRPEGPIVTIRVEAVDIRIDLPVFGALLGLDGMTLPTMPVTVTSEDLKS